MSIMHNSVVAAPLDEVFAWHERPGAFERLTPPWQPVKLVQESDSVEEGDAILGLPFGLRWVARHDPGGYLPPHQFVDQTVEAGIRSLPIAMILPWRHRRQFEAVDAENTRATDRVTTWVGSRVLRPMFRYRHRQLADDLAAHRWATQLGVKPTTIAVTGSSGLVGSALCAFLTTGGHRVIRLVRRPARGPDERQWNPMSPGPTLLEGVDAVVHLAGESIFGRFTDGHKQTIRDSRIEPTRLLADLAARSPNGPKTFVSASAIGFYGSDRGEESLTESSSVGDGFLAEVVSDWEGATKPAADGGVRVVTVRTGIVQAAQGGTLRLFRPLFEVGLGGPVAGGDQWFSWIDLNDLLDVYHRALFDEKLSGPVNAVAPEPVRNAEYARTLARILRRPALLPVPRFGPRLLLGTEGSEELAEANQLVEPQALQKAGHTFRHPSLEGSLRHQLGGSLG